MTLLHALLYALVVLEGLLIVVVIYACQLLQRSATALEALVDSIDRLFDPLARRPR